MNWDAIGALGDLIGGAAVVISIVYLALQIRAQNAQSEIAAGLATQQSLQASTFGLIPEENRAVLIKGSSSYRSLSNSDKLAFHLLMLSSFFDFDLSRRLYRQGLFTNEAMRINEQWIADLLSTPGGREYWQLEEHWLNAPAKTAIDELLQRGIGQDFRAKLDMALESPAQRP